MGPEKLQVRKSTLWGECNRKQSQMSLWYHSSATEIDGEPKVLLVVKLCTWYTFHRVHSFDFDVNRERKSFELKSIQLLGEIFSLFCCIVQPNSHFKFNIFWSNGLHTTPGRKCRFVHCVFLKVRKYPEMTFFHKLNILHINFNIWMFSWTCRISAFPLIIEINWIDGSCLQVDNRKQW